MQQLQRLWMKWVHFHISILSLNLSFFYFWFTCCCNLSCGRWLPCVWWRGVGRWLPCVVVERSWCCSGSAGRSATGTVERWLTSCCHQVPISLYYYYYVFFWRGLTEDECCWVPFQKLSTVVCLCLSFLYNEELGRFLLQTSHYMSGLRRMLGIGLFSFWSPNRWVWLYGKAFFISSKERCSFCLHVVMFYNNGTFSTSFNGKYFFSLLGLLISEKREETCELLPQIQRPSMVVVTGLLLYGLNLNKGH